MFTENTEKLVRVLLLSALVFALLWVLVPDRLFTNAYVGADLTKGFVSAGAGYFFGSLMNAILFPPRS